MLGLGLFIPRIRGALAPAGPVALAAPALSGLPQAGLALSATAGIWAGAESLAWAWQRDGADIPGAAGTGGTVAPLALGPADAGHAVRLRVTATGPGGSATAVSAPATVLAMAFRLDYAAAAYEVLGAARDFAGAHGFARPSAAFADDLAGHWAPFAPHVPRRTDRGLMLEGAAPGLLARIGWDGARVPLAAATDGTAWTTDFDRADWLPDAHFVTTFHVNFATGSSGNSGLSPESPKSGIHQAILAGNATGQPYRVLVEAGTIPRSHSFSNSGVVTPTQDCAILAVNGRVTTGNFDSLAWPAAPDATHGSCWRVTRSNVARVLDLLGETPEGDRPDLVRVADAATCNATPGSWAQVGSELWVHRADGAAVTNANTRVLVLSKLLWLDATSKRLWIRGFDLEGSLVRGVLDVNGTQDTVVIAEDCSFRYGGTETTGVDGVALNNASGLFAFVNCRASANSKDGFNAHWTQDASRACQVLTLGCTATGNGRGTQASCNGITGHETVTWVDVGGSYRRNRGGMVRFVGDARLLALGTQAGEDLGDGVTTKAGFRADDTAEIWAIDAGVEMAAPGDAALLATGQGRIRHRNLAVTAGTVGTAGVEPAGSLPAEDRAADALAVTGLPAGTLEVTLVHDDGSTAVLAGETVAGGAWSLSPAALARPRLARIEGRYTALSGAFSTGFSAGFS